MFCLYGWRLFKFFSKVMSTEDLYQKNVKSRYGNAWIEITLNFINEYNTFIAGRRLKEYIDQKFNTDTPLVSTLEPFESPTCDFPTVLFYNPQTYQLKIYFDHARIGGATFMRSTTYMIGGDPKAVKLINHKDVPWYMRDYSMLRFAVTDIPRLWYMKPSLSVREVPRLEHKRFQGSLIPGEFKRRTLMINTCLKNIWEGLDPSVYYLKIYLPVAMEDIPGVYNNVGVVFMTVTRDMGLKELEDTLKGNWYQAIATNEILRTGTKAGSCARKSIDVIMTMLYMNANNDKLDCASVTFNNPPEYPLYCMSITYNDQYFVTITSNTDDFDAGPQIAI